MAGHQPEYLRVRREIFELISGSVSGDDKIPTEFELCKRFGVGRTTLRRALKLLVDEGILVTRSGIGTFVSPVYRQSQAAVAPIGETRIGFCMNSGRMLRFWRENSLKFMSVLDYLTERGYPVDLITFTGDSSDAVKYLKNQQINFLIWASPLDSQLEMLRAIKNAGIKLVLLESYPYSDFNVAGTDGFKLGYMAAEYLISHGRKNLWHITYNPDESVYHWKHEGFSKAMGDYGLTPVRENSITADELEYVCKYGSGIDGIFCQAGLLEDVQATLEKHNIKVPEACEIITVNHSEKFPAIPECLMESGHEAAKITVKLIEHDGNNIIHKLLPPNKIIN